MIALRRSRGAIPAAFRQPRLNAAALKLVDIYYDGQEQGTFAFTSSDWKPAKTALKKETGGKCAYCEAPTAVVAHGDVEHFRPKSKYWWLAFCFDNYLYSCQLCNQTYKGDNFPISGTATPAPVVPMEKPAGPDLEALAASLILDASAVDDHHVAGMWAGEDADLPHPCLEDPEPLFAYEADADNEEVWVRSAGGPRADRAVTAAHEYLGINRDELRRERYVNYLTLAMLKSLLDAGLPVAAREMAILEVRRMQASKEPFCGMRRYFARIWGLPGPL